MMRRAALYARVSTASQAHEDRSSLAAQRAAYLRRCTERGYTPTTEFQDVESGRSLQRRAYQQMLTTARKRELDVIVVTFLDRFGRNEREILRRVLELEELGVEVDAVHDDTREFILLALTAWKAGEESRRIGERTKIASAQAVKRGVAMGRAPFGYRKHVEVAEDGRRSGFRLVADPRTAPIVRDVFDWYARDNLSQLQIARRLNGLGVPSATGSVWTGEGVRYLLRRPAYAGEFVWGEARVQGAHEALVSLETWEATRARLAVKAGLPAGRTQSSPYLLSGLFFCGHCGRRMEGNTTSPRGHYYRRYRCATYRKSRACSVPNYHHAERVEGSVIAALSDILGDLDLLRETATERAEGLRAQLSTAEARLSSVAERFTRNMRMFDQGVIANEEQLAIANGELAGEQEGLGREIARLRAEVRDAESRFTSLEEWPQRSQSFADYTETLEPPARKALVQQLVSRVEISDGDTVPRVTLRVPSS